MHHKVEALIFCLIGLVLTGLGLGLYWITKEVLGAGVNVFFGIVIMAIGMVGMQLKKCKGEC